MKIYGLTEIGETLAHSTDNPNTIEWKIVHMLSFMGTSTQGQLAENIGVDSNQIGEAIWKLKRRNIIKEVG